MTRIAILEDYQGAAARFGDWSSLPADCEVVSFADHVTDPDALVARLRHFEVAVTMRERLAFPREVLARLPDLRLLVTTGYRNPVIDVGAAEALGITVCYTGGYLEATIELTWGLIIGLLRHIPVENARVRAGGWQSTIGTDLNRATLGVVGLGNMGRPVARIGRAFGMRVIAWSQNMTQAACDEAGIEFVTREQLFREADVVSIHLQLRGERNRGLIGAAELALMKPSAVLVNTSRGPIVEEAALVEALRAKRIAGAALDVFDSEPPAADHPLRHLPNVLATPHLGYVTHNTYRVFFDDAVDDIRAFLAGAPTRVLPAEMN